jgi:2'-5' RNA ligase
LPRLFAAIPLPDSVRSDLALLQTRIAGARWVKQEQLHLTLRFIGETIDADYQRCREALAAAVIPLFNLQLKGIGHFPPRGAPRVLWAGVTDCPELLVLQKRIEKSLTTAGLPADKHAYTPHLTLARLERTPPREVGEYIVANNLFKSEVFPVTEFRLYSSKLNPGGVVHTVEAVYPLV